MKRSVLIEPSSKANWINFKELFSFIDLLYYQVLKEISVKYRQTAFGPVWIILQPILNTVIFTFVFSNVARLESERAPYYLLVYTALVPWTFFQNATTLASSSLVTEVSVISKIYFPRIILPLSYTFARLIDFTINFILLLLILLFSGFYPNFTWLLLFYYVFIMILFTIGISCATSALEVVFRDVKLIVRYGLQLMMFLTPVGYLSEKIPSHLIPFFKLNPMFYCCEGFRNIILDMKGRNLYFNFYDFSLPLFISLMTLFLGVYFFSKMEKNIVDLI